MVFRERIYARTNIALRARSACNWRRLRLVSKPAFLKPKRGGDSQSPRHPQALVKISRIDLAMPASPREISRNTRSNREHFCFCSCTRKVSYDSNLDISRGVTWLRQEIQSTCVQDGSGRTSLKMSKPKCKENRTGGSLTYSGGQPRPRSRLIARTTVHSLGTRYCEQSVISIESGC